MDRFNWLWGWLSFILLAQQSTRRHKSGPWMSNHDMRTNRENENWSITHSKQTEQWWTNWSMVRCSPHKAEREKWEEETEQFLIHAIANGYLETDWNLPPAKGPTQPFRWSWGTTVSVARWVASPLWAQYTKPKATLQIIAHIFCKKK